MSTNFSAALTFTRVFADPADAPSPAKVPRECLRLYRPDPHHIVLQIRTEGTTTGTDRGVRKVAYSHASMTPHEARALAAELLRLADEVEGSTRADRERETL